MTTFAEAVARISSQKHFLFEVEPAEQLWNWSPSVGGDSYSATWSHLTQTSVIKGGLYRQLVGVEENGVALTETDSAGRVETDAGTYYFDKAASKIWVHTTGTVDPDTLDMMAAVFRIHASTTGKIFSKTVGSVGMDFDGAVDNYFRGIALTGAADGKQCIFSSWFRLDAGDGAVQFLMSGNNWAHISYLSVRRHSDNKMVVLFADATGQYVTAFYSASTYTASAVWHHIYVSLDAANKIVNLYIDGADDKGVYISDPEVDHRYDVDFTLSMWDIAAFDNGSSAFFNGVISELYFNSAEYLGPNGHRKFRGPNGDPVPLGDNGELPTGTAPIIYCPNGDGTNQGTGGNFSVTGAPVVASGPMIERRDILYERRILADSDMSVTEKASDLVIGMARTSSGSVKLSNHDGLFDIPAYDWSWKNRKARVRFGIDDIALVQYLMVRELVVDDIVHTEESLKINLVEAIDPWRRRFPPTPHFGPTLGEGVEGTRVPVLIGAKTDIIPDLVDDEGSLPNNWSYRIGDNNFQTLDAVSAVYAINKSTGARQTLTLAVDYTVQLADCYIVVTDAFDPGAEIEEVYEIRCDAVGQPAAAGDTSTDYLKFPGEIAHWLLNTFLDYADGALQLDTFAAADVGAPYPLAFWIKDETDVRAVLRKLGVSVMGDVRTDLDGTIKFYLWTPWEGAADAESYSDEDFGAFEGDIKIETVYYETVVRYNEDPANKDSYELETITDAGIDYLVSGAQILTVDTYLTSADDAVLLAKHVNLLYRGKDVELVFTERGIRLMGAEKNTRIRVTKSRAPTSTGALTNRMMEIVEIDKDLAAPSISGRLSDKNLVNLVGKWAAATAPAWADADGEEKADSGFWTDAAGLADPADRASKNVSIWW